MSNDTPGAMGSGPDIDEVRYVAYATKEEWLAGQVAKFTNGLTPGMQRVLSELLTAALERSGSDRSELKGRDRPVMTPLVDIPTAATILNVPEGWLRDKVWKRQVPFTKIGKHVRFTEEHLQEIIASGEGPVLAPRPASRRRTRL